jgi:hypothetical protein
MNSPPNAKPPDVSGKQMTTTTKILTGLCLVIFTSCNNQSLSKHPKSSISFDNGKILIDTSRILNNQNLQFFIDELSKQELYQKKTFQEIPSFIRTFLDSLTGNFSIANPGEIWRVGCTGPFEVDSASTTKKIDKKTGDTIYQVCFKEFPARQLNYFGLGNDVALMKYYSGGIAKIEHILIFKFNKETLVDFWSGTGNIFKDNDTKSEILKCLQDNKNKDWGLNTNIMYL